MQRSEATQKKRVPIDNIKASGWRRQAKRRCLWVGIIIALRLVDLANAHDSDYRPSAIAQKRRVECVALFWLHRSLRRYADLANTKNARRRKNTRTRIHFFKRANKADKMP